MAVEILLQVKSGGVGYKDNDWFAKTESATGFKTTNINLLGGTIGNDTTDKVYGGNNSQNTDLTTDTILEKTNIIIGAEGKTPRIRSAIYGSGVNDHVESTNIDIVAFTMQNSDTKLSVYGGSDSASKANTTNVNLKGATIDTIYGGSNAKGDVENSNVNIESGNVTNVYGGGNKIGTTTSNVTMKGGSVNNIYGGSNVSGVVTTSNVMLKAGWVMAVYGGGNNVEVTNSNITLDGSYIPLIVGGSYQGGKGDKSNISLISGNVETVFGGGENAGVNNAEVTLNGAGASFIYGGSNISGDNGTTKVNLLKGNVNTVFGGNYLGGVTTTANVNLQGTATVNEIYGGGQNSSIGTSSAKGKININVTGGTVQRDINGGSKECESYADVNINIGKNAINSSLTANDINIEGYVYGCGTSEESNNRGTNIKGAYDYDFNSINGNINIKIDGTGHNVLNIKESIFGAGNGATYTGTATINIANFGTSLKDVKHLTSIQRANKVIINNSYIEMQGITDIVNYYVKMAYSFNRVDNLTIYNNTKRLQFS